MQLPENQIRYMERPEISETFVDSLGVVTFDGVTRLEMCATRLDLPKPSEKPTAKRYPVCRVVMTPEATVALFNQLQNIMNVLHQAGLVTKQEGQPPEAINPH